MSEEKATKSTLSRADRKCSVEGCKRPYRAKSYCVVHYQAWRRGEIQGHRARYKTCSKEGCRKPAERFGLCGEHAGGAKAEAPAA
jgi:hypothetical protein